MGKAPIIEVISGNVLDIACDVLVLKYAQGWHGADQAAAKKMNLNMFWDGPKPGDFRTVIPERSSGISAPLILFEGVPHVKHLSYASMRALGRSSMLHLGETAPNVRHVAMTMHGVNTGLDEKESFLAQVAGIITALSHSNPLPDLEKITIVELRKDRAERLHDYLQSLLPNQPIAITESSTTKMESAVASVGSDVEKPHVFVAMPFTEEMEDVYIFGIQGPVQQAGLLCERVDMDIFTGDILDRIKSRIETATFVIAILNGANANVYLEVGYAWGKNKKTLLVCKNPDELKFDVKGQRCVIYSSINDLNKKLAKELEAICK